LLEKLTWGFAIALVVLTLASHMIIDKNEAASATRSINQERAAQAPGAPAGAPAPAAVAPATEGENALPAQPQTGEKPAVATPDADVAKPQPSNDPLTQPAK